MKKSILKLFTISLLGFLTIKPMEPANNWDILKDKGPLAILQFQEEEIDENGNHICWLEAKEFNDKILARIILHNSGYYIDFIDPKYKISLTPGFYFLKSEGKIKINPESPKSYVAYPTSNDPLGPDTGVGSKEYYQDLKLISKMGGYFGRLNRYQYLPSFEKAFNGSTKVYLTEKIEPIPLSITIKADFEGAYHYYEMTPHVRNKLLSIIKLDHPQAYDILREWLKDKLKNSGLYKGSYSDINTREGTMNEDRIIDQYITECIIDDVKRGNKEINIYLILEDIQKLEPCNEKEREGFEKYLIDRFKKWKNRRIRGLQAKGLIECNSGLLQWD